MEEAEPAARTADQLLSDLAKQISSSTRGDAISMIGGLVPRLAAIADASDDPTPSFSEEAQELKVHLQNIQGVLTRLQLLKDHLDGGVLRIVADMRTNTSQVREAGRGQDMLRLLRENVQDLILDRPNKYGSSWGGKKEGNDRVKVETLARDIEDNVSSLVRNARPSPPSTDESPAPVKDVQVPLNPISDLIRLIRDGGDEIDVASLLKSVQEVVKETANRDNDLHKRAKQLQQDLNRVNITFNKLNQLGDHVGGGMRSILRRISASEAGEDEDKFRLLGQMVSYLTLKIPPLPKLQSTDAEDRDRLQDITSFGLHNLLAAPSRLQLEDHLIDPSCFPFIVDSPIFQDLVQEFLGQCGYDRLDIEYKMCLFCFAALPANALVKKRLLVHWWTGEDLTRKSADDVLEKLMAHGYISPVIKKYKLVGFKMDPLMHLMVVYLAHREGFLDFDSVGVPTADFSWSHRACLVRTGGQDSRRDLTRKTNTGQERLRTIFNVNDPYPDFPTKWFSKLKYLHVLCLGGWLGSLGEYLELEDPKFLDAIGNLKHLRLFSLQGISGISELPKSISGIISLRILDLNACTSLEVLPPDIGSLENLMHLDVSECYWLKRIPKSLAQLKQLEVLKGFTVGEADETKESCTLLDLKEMENLRKLSIITYGGEEFLNVYEVDVLKGLRRLEKLSIEWRGKLEQTNRDNKLSTSSKSKKARNVKTWWRPGKGRRDDSTQKERRDHIEERAHFRWVRARAVPFISGLVQRTKPLDKLELVGFPGTKVSARIIDKFRVKKLCIKGGNLQSFEDGALMRRVKILRLKFLTDFEMDWRALTELCPELVYFQHASCPKLIFIPEHRWSAPKAGDRTNAFT